MTNNQNIGTLQFIKMFFRSFFLQAVWNYQSLISIGFAYTLMPAMHKMFKSKQSKIDFLNRHLNFFNAHPYFASFAIGAIIRVEEEITKGEGTQEQVDRLKNAMIGPLGAIGDQMFWGTIKPAAILLGVISVLMIKDITIFLYLFVILLLIYNIPHLYIRYYGIVEGYRQGFNVYKLLSIARYQKYKNFYMSVGAISLGFVISYSFLTYEQSNIFQSIAFILCLIVAYFFHKLKRSFYRNAIFSLIAAIVLGIIIENL